MTRSQAFIKRTFDILWSMGSLLVFAIPMAIIALAIKMDSPGPVFFLQERVGKNGKKYRLCKFRTMVVGAEKMGAGIDVVEADPRITRIGRHLRRWCIDELPQLFNVLAGHMSIVGPRPTLAYQVEQYTPQQCRRLLVKPGMTGWAQVKGRNLLTWPERIRFDLEYIDNYSFLLDLKIIALTFNLLISEKGVYGEGWKKGDGASEVPLDSSRRDPGGDEKKS